MLMASSLMIGWSLLAPAAQAQWVQLGPWEGAVEGVMDWVNLDTSTGGVDASPFHDLQLEEQLTLRNSGISLYDPRLMTLSLGGTFGVSQEWPTTGQERAFRHGTLGSYDVFTRLLPEQLYSLNVFSSRHQSILSRELAGRSDVRTEQHGATLFARGLGIPSTFSLRQVLQEELSRAGGVASSRREQQRILSYEGQRGWIDADLDVRYEFIDHADAIFPTFDYQSHESSANYGLDFGTELNRHWDSRLRYFTRDGMTALTIASVDELLRVEHSDRLETSYHYLLTDTQVPGGSVTTQTLTFTAQHQLYESLKTTFTSEGVLQAVPGGDDDILRNRLDATYTKRLPGEGRLLASLGTGVDYERSRFDALTNFVPQESHTVSTSVALPVILRNVFVSETTVVVTKTGVGPLPPGCVAPSGPPTPLVLGRDYTLRTIGELTQIAPIPCLGSDPGLNPGDTIAVDYQYDTTRSRTLIAAHWHAELSVDYDWIRPYVSHAQTAQELLSGHSNASLGDEQSDTVGTEFRVRSARVRASLLGELSRFQSAQLHYQSVQSMQYVTISVWPNLTANLSAHQSRLDFDEEDRRTTTFIERASVTYVAGGSVTVELQGSLRQVADTVVPTERVAETRLSLRGLLRSFELSPVLAWRNRRRGDTNTRDLEATVRMVRRF
jgi:hypothetical protein